jgi:hypothetical protein
MKEEMPSRSPMTEQRPNIEMVEIENNQVIKLFPKGYPKKKVEEERRMTRLAKDMGIEAAYVHDIVERDGRTGLVFDKIIGPNYREWMQKSPMAWPKMGKYFAYEHRELHMHMAPELPSVKQALKQQIESGHVPEMIRKDALNLLDRLPDGDHFCHMNYVPETVVVALDGPTLIDFSEAGRGSFMADVAKTCVLLTVGEDDILSRILLGTYQTEYMKICNRPDDELQDWMMIVATAMLAGSAESARPRLMEIIESSR